VLAGANDALNCANGLNSLGSPTPAPCPFAIDNDPDLKEILTSITALAHRSEIASLLDAGFSSFILEPVIFVTDEIHR
jgi:hypothetical protein